MSVEASTRVALVASSYAPYVGGVETHVAHVARALLAQGYGVEVWTVDRAGVGRVVREGELTVRHLPAPLPARAVASIARFGVNAPRAWSTWRAARREFLPSIIHVQCFGPNGVYATELAATTGTSLIVTSHGETLGDDHNVFDDSALLRGSLRRAVARAAAVTAPSEYVLRDLRERFGLHGGTIVSNGVEPRPRPMSHPEGRYLLAVGRLGRMKGFDLLIDAFARADIPDEVTLLIGGDGPERDRLEQMVRERRLGDRVQFRGWMEPSAVAEAMASAVAVVVPSRSEAFGIVALEAWSAGTALVMTSRGGASEFMTDGVDALLVDPLDTDALAAALRRIVDPAIRDLIAERGRARVAEFSWERVADGYSEIYGGVLAASSRGRSRGGG